MSLSLCIHELIPVFSTTLTVSLCAQNNGEMIDISGSFQNVSILSER